MVCWVGRGRVLAVDPAGQIMMVPLTAADLDRMAEVVETYGDFPLGLVDAPVIAVAERLKADAIATLDHRHFSVVRPRHLPALKLLPGPVTNQVTTSPAHAGRLLSWPDGKPGLTCMALTISDHARRTRQAWHARGQGFESP